MNHAHRSGRHPAPAQAGTPFPLRTLAVALMLSFAASSQAGPAGGVVAAGNASIAVTGARTTITQTTQNAAINWQSFGIAAGESVQFAQPNSSSVALNRVLGANPSAIFGDLSANGKVFLINPNGVLFGAGSTVNVGGLVASTLGLADADFMAGQYRFSSPGRGAVVNEGTIRADGGSVALLGTTVSNQGVISARLGSVVLAGGNAITLDWGGDGLLGVKVDQGAVDALVTNGGLIQADGGRVVMTTQAAGSLLSTVVNNTGVIQARTLENRNGTILLLGDMQGGTANVAGTLDASAPNGGNGGFIETSAAHVNVASDVRITTAAPLGVTGTWLIDPADFVIAPLGGNITGPTLSGQLVTSSVVITTTAGPGPGNGDIVVNDAVSWNGAAAPGASTTLTLNAVGSVNINRPITAVDGNLVVCCGADVRVDVAGPITATRGSVLLSAGRDLFLNGAVTVTDGNLTVCAAHDVNINSSITVTNGTIDPVRSLGLSRGLVISAGNGANGPGVNGGTVFFNPINPATVTAAPTTIFYNPVSYAAPTDFAINIIGTAPTQFMFVFPQVLDKTFNPGDTSAILSGFKSTPVSGLVPANVALVAGPLATANFATDAVGVGKNVTFSGFSLTQAPIVPGGAGSNFALPVSCCAPLVGNTTGNIMAAVVVPPPPPPPPP